MCYIEEVLNRALRIWLVTYVTEGEDDLYKPSLSWLPEAEATNEWLRRARMAGDI
jgi:hypothetical protein